MHHKREAKGVFAAPSKVSSMAFDTVSSCVGPLVVYWFWLLRFIFSHCFVRFWLHRSDKIDPLTTLTIPESSPFSWLPKCFSPIWCMMMHEKEQQTQNTDVIFANIFAKCHNKFVTYFSSQEARISNFWKDFILEGSSKQCECQN